MFSELTSFVERLQDAAASIARLETENGQLRSQLADAQVLAATAARQPALELELADLRRQLTDVQTRLLGAEEGRNAAVEARMRAEQGQGAIQEELARLRSEHAMAQAHAASLDAQLDAKRRIAADTAKSLRTLAGMLEG